MYHFPYYIVDLRSDPTLVGCNIFRVARVFFVVWRLVRSNQDGERAEPLAKMLLGAKHAGRPPIVSRIIVKRVLRSLSVPNVFYSDVLSFRSRYRIPLHIFRRLTKV